MKIRELFSLEDEQKALDDGFLTVRKSGRYRVYNYSNLAAVSEESWENPAVLNSRGLIVDDRDVVVARPWKKFFNYNQPQVGDLDFTAPAEVTDKADGSLGILFYDPTTHSGTGISTRGSLESDQAKHAQKLIETTNTLWPGYVPGDIDLSGCTITPLVEIIYPNNRIVLSYGDFDNLVLLGGVDIDSGDYIGPKATASIIEWKGEITKVFNYSSLQEALEAPPRDNAEGLVVRTGRNTLVKIKQEDYVMMHRAIFDMNELRVWELIKNKASLNEILEPIPDEVHSWVRDVYEDFTSRVKDLIILHEEWLQGMYHKLGYEVERKIIAQSAQAAEGINMHVVFALHDGDTDRAASILLDSMRPTGGGDRPVLRKDSGQ